MGKIENAWKEDIKKPSKKTVQDVEAKFKTDDDVIAIGDVFFANVEQEWVVQPSGPIAHKCKTLIELINYYAYCPKLCSNLLGL